MRVLLIPAVAVGVLVVPSSDEPSEAAMRNAFQATLSAQVQSALNFAAETGGEEAVVRVRAARTDAFDIRSFTKLDCAPSDSPQRATSGHVCGFSVRIGVVSGVLEHALSGRFYAGRHGLVFEDAAPAGVLSRPS
jgi:hypothetical protein